MPPQHGDGRGAGGRRRLRGDPGGHPGGVLQVRRRELHRDPPTRRRSGGAQLRKDLRGIRFCCRLSESDASSHRPQVRQQSGRHQILRSGQVPQTRVLRAQSELAVEVEGKTRFITSSTRQTGLQCFFTEYRTLSFSFNTHTVNVTLKSPVVSIRSGVD